MPGAAATATRDSKASDTRTTFWCGTLKGSPRQNLDFAGVTFPAFSNPPDENDPTGAERIRFAGMMNTLDEAQVAAVRKAIAKKVVRWRTHPVKDKKTDEVENVRTTGDVLDTEAKLYIRRKDDEPIGRYVYMVERDAPMAPGNFPDPFTE